MKSHYKVIRGDWVAVFDLGGLPRYGARRSRSELSDWWTMTTESGTRTLVRRPPSICLYYTRTGQMQCHSCAIVMVVLDGAEWRNGAKDGEIMACCCIRLVTSHGVRPAEQYKRWSLSRIIIQRVRYQPARSWRTRTTSTENVDTGARFSIRDGRGAVVRRTHERFCDTMLS